MTSVLSFEVVLCQSGPEAIAIAWVGFVLTAGSFISLFIEKRRSLDRMVWPGWSSTDTTSAHDTVVEEEAGPNLEMPEHPPEPEPTWQQPQMPPNIAWLLYLAGQNMERTVRQRNTATWVDRDDIPRNGHMDPGYAETIHE